MSRTDKATLLADELKDLQSDRETVREKAVKNIRQTFSLPSTLHGFGNNPKAWLALFQALFQAYRAQLTKCITKLGSVSALNDADTHDRSVGRLTETAGTIRFLAQISKELLTSSVLKSLLSHLFDGIAHDGRIVAAVASDYAHAIESIITWRPHLQGLHDRDWHALLALSFNIVLGRPPRRELAEDIHFPVSTSRSNSDTASDPDQSISAGSSTPLRQTRLDASASLKRPRQHSPLSRAGTRAGPSRYNPVQHQTSLQAPFMRIISLLLHSPTAPVLAMPEDPTNSDDLINSEDPYSFPRKLLGYFSYFLHIHPTESSLRQDYLSALSAALGHYAINCRLPVLAFAASSWQSLVGMWSTKDGEKSDDVVIVLRLLFPILAAEPLGLEDARVKDFDLISAFSVLWSAAEGIANRNASGVLLDSLQLRIGAHCDSLCARRAFSSATFQYGWGLDRTRALAWATLQLQADCAERLYLHTETTYTTTAVGRKRIKLENPVSVLLQSLRTRCPRDTKVHHLQVLLFFAETHWHVLHMELRNDIIASLTALVAFEDADVQSWTFLCLAAIAHAECSRAPASSLDSQSSSAILWDPVWTHAMRRANVPAVSRAACHAAHVLLFHSKRLLSSQRVLGEVESFAKDLDVQGPAYPYDSVCGFMASCLRFANQDVRLYRMQMEEKVLSWLMEAWRIDGARRLAMPMSTVAHIHSLLEAITGCSRRVDLRCEIMLPPSPVVDAMVEETRTNVIRDFQLHARLPPYRPTSTSVDTASAARSTPGEGRSSGPFLEEVDTADLAPPRGRERRLSAFFLKSLEAMFNLLSPGEETHSKPTVETLRSSLDFAISALFFEASLVMNGTQSNRRTVQAACKLIGVVAPALVNPRWEAQERRLLLGFLDPLILADDPESDETGEGGWEALVPPGERTGIRAQVLEKLLSATRTDHANRALRYALQRCMFRSADVQDAFAGLLKHLREVLRMVAQRAGSLDSRHQGEDHDDFAPALDTSMSAEATQKSAAIATHHNHIVQSCVTALATIPILQSSSGEPTHDEDLLKLLLNCQPPQFLVLAPACLEHILHRRLHLSRSNFRDLLDQVDELCGTYTYRNNEPAQLLIVQMLEATSQFWCRSTQEAEPMRKEARGYCTQCITLLRSKGRRSWRVRDSIVRFLDKYLALDPTQEVWLMPGADKKVPFAEDLPAAVLPDLADDDDIRIRFRIAATSPRLFNVGRLAGRELMTVYHEIRSKLSSNQANFEHMITRFICLGNMVTSEASARRGAYWHLLEVSLYNDTYRRHLKAVLEGVTTRMGIERFADLFNSYASQFAYSMRLSNLDVFRFPPELLGYRDRRECAEATFHAFTSTNLLAAGSADEVDTGKELFARHCQAIQRTEEQGIRDCFAELIAHQTTFWLDCHSNTVDPEADLENVLRSKTRFAKREQFRELFERNVDHIVVAILKTLGDHDVSGNGPIVAALRQRGADDVVETFQLITKYRKLDNFDAYTPNLPCYGTPIILHSLSWYCSQIKDADSPSITYHVLHHLFADLERSPLVNEQYRLLNALCLWISCHHTQFRDTSLLRVLMRRTTAMFAQSDLVRGAQSILEWALELYKTYVPKTDHRLTDVLIRTSTLAHEFLETTGTPYLAELGNELMAWVEAQAELLRKSKAMRRQVVRALAAWPREVPPSLRSACDDLQIRELNLALNDHGISSSKFRLVRKLYDVTSRDHETNAKHPFGSSDFWRLKACIPPREHLLDSDIDAFTSLLVLHHGVIDSLGGEKFASDTVCSRHRKAVAGRGKEIAPRAELDLARSATILSLLEMLDTSAAPQVHVVYTTLRGVMSVSSSENFVDASLPSDARRELEYMLTFRGPQCAPLAPDLSVVLAGEDMLHLASEFPNWITRTASLVCEALGARDPFFSPLTPLLQSDPAFAEEVLPVLVHTLLQIEFDDSASSSPTSLRTVLSNYLSLVLEYEDAQAFCFRAIISVVLHLRSFQPSREPRDALAHDKWLLIDFTLLARCAIQCGAYTTALLFLELAQEHPAASEATTRNISTEDILFGIYSHIDEPDGFYGIQTDDLRNLFVKRLRHEKQWDKAFRYHGAVLESGQASTADTEGIVESLYSFGFNHLAMNTLQHFSDSNNTLGTNNIAYDLAWRAETWDLPETLAANHSGATLYLAMRAVFRERNAHVVDAVTRRALTHEMQRIRDLGSENFTEIRQVVQNLMCLGQIRQWRSEDSQRDLQAGNVNGERWRVFARLDPEFEFKNIEAILTTRISLIRSLRQKAQRDQIGDLVSPFCASLLDLERACLLCLSERARDANESQVALNSVTRAQHLERQPSSAVAREFSNVLWLIQEPKLAIKSLGTLVTSPEGAMVIDDVSSNLQRASLLAQLGTWSAEASMKKPSQIVTDCFAPAVDIVLAADVQTAAERNHPSASIFHQYAIFAERQYHAISQSPDALRWKLYIDRKKEEMKRRAIEMTRVPNTSPDFASLLRQQTQADVLLKQDQERAREHLGQRTSFLSLAIEMYSRCLSSSDAFDDDSPIRLCSLWLANFDSDDAALRFEDALDRVPSRKFVFLSHQLTARLWNAETSAPSPNQAILQNVILRMCREHPFHSLFPLYCLKVDRASSQTSSASRRQSGRHASQPPSQMERAIAATDIFDKLRSDPQSAERIKDVELVCDASLQWAKHPIKAYIAKANKNARNHPVPEALLIRQIKDIKVPVITAHTPIDPTTRYEDCVWIHAYDTRYTTAGGMNLPKIIRCTGNDGIMYKQLYKGEGNDDLRQDAVMEQVFDLVNVVLRRDRETKRRKLSVRGYKVIPLAPQAGVLEFVENTIPLGAWVKPAHTRYHPQDWKHEYIMKFVPGSQQGEWRKKPEAVMQRFHQVREHYKPVMRHYFTEKHKTPMSWYTMRLHYARSVATNSIVGHILGVGDRHLSNILIDNKTGEVVHIDLGIAFEQGKLLPQPERVPFRLTADMVDGLGISGTQGVFQRCAEETLRVLRAGSEIILTVLEVFKYDPLHSWTASELKIKRVQASVPDETAQLTGAAFRFAIGIDMASGAADEAADRALSAVARKLDKTLSVEYTVNELITEASDPTNLALMYIGWAPHW